MAKKSFTVQNQEIREAMVKYLDTSNFTKVNKSYFFIYTDSDGVEHLGEMRPIAKEDNEDMTAREVLDAMIAAEREKEEKKMRLAEEKRMKKEKAKNKDNE